MSDKSGSTSERISGALRSWRLELHSAGEFGRACKLIRQERLAEAAEVLKAILKTTGPAGGRTGARSPFFTRFVVAQALSTTAAKLGDMPTALASIREVLPQWRELEPTFRSEATRRDMQEWAAWAQRYTDSVTGN